MSKRIKVLVSVVVAVVLLVAMGTATSVTAQEEKPAPTPQAGANGLFSRVAKILDIPQEKLVSAFEQARQEMGEECQATGNCTIRQENVNRFRQQWMEKRQGMGKRFQNNGTESQQKTRLHSSQSGRGRQRIALSLEGGVNHFRPNY